MMAVDPDSMSCWCTLTPLSVCPITLHKSQSWQQLETAAKHKPAGPIERRMDDLVPWQINCADQGEAVVGVAEDVQDMRSVHE